MRSKFLKFLFLVSLLPAFVFPAPAHGFGFFFSYILYGIGFIGANNGAYHGGGGFTFVPATPYPGIYSPSFGPNYTYNQLTRGPGSFTLTATRRTPERALSTLQNDARTVMRDACNQIGTGAAILVDGRIRPLLYTYQVETLDVTVDRDGTGFTGGADITFFCVLR